MGKRLNDLKCTLIQKAVYAKLYKGHKPNEWEPWHAPELKKLPSGLICRSDVKYGETYPNSFADIWYPDESGEKRPVVVYFHGGGFIFGNKSSGDPLQTGGGGVGKLEAIVKAGYILVNADYALAPQYRFPVPIRQTDELFRYLIAHQEELHLDLSHVCLSGGSAGANMTVITNVNKPKAEAYTTLNYQFLSTLSMTSEEFRPRDLPDGWERNPAGDSRNWITKTMEQRYHELCVDPEGRARYFTEQDTPFGRAVKKNALLVNEPAAVKELSDAAEHVLRDYSVGHLTVPGDNRYLSGDLLEFLVLLIDTKEVVLKKKNEVTFYNIALSQRFVKNGFYAPGAVYESGEVCTLLRNPHIARNEEIQLTGYGKAEQMRKHYLGHLHGVVMVDAEMLAAERLGGADYDGDMVKTISDPLLNKCVKRNYEFDSLDNSSNLPLLYIPSEDPVIRNANDWHDRFLTVRDTFSSRVGQICNAAFNRSVVAYDEKADDFERRRCREETETLAILTGLEIDSAKSGVKPILSQYLGPGKQPRSPFLDYKTLLDEDGDNTRFVTKSKRKKQDYFDLFNWSSITSNVERLPYLAEQLRTHTPKLKPVPAADSELFSFAARPNWKELLDREKLSAISNLTKTYDSVLNRIRYYRSSSRIKPKRNDIDRILYSRGQEELFDPDDLYAAFSELHPERIAALRQDLQPQHWHLMDLEERYAFLSAQIPELEQWFDLFADFRRGGYRVLGDLVCDTDDKNRETEQKQLYREGDSELFREMVKAYADEPFAKDYSEEPTKVCRRKLLLLVKERLAVQYLVAVGRRDLLWTLVPEEALREVKRYAE